MTEREWLDLSPEEQALHLIQWLYSEPDQTPAQIMTKAIKALVRDAVAKAKQEVMTTIKQSDIFARHAALSARTRRTQSGRAESASSRGESEGGD